MNRRQKIIVSVTGIFLVLLILVGLTYAYFLTRVTGNTNTKSISVKTANLALVYGDGNGILEVGEVLVPGDTVKFKKTDGTVVETKEFSVKNEGNATTDYVVIIDEVNVFYTTAGTTLDGTTYAANQSTKFESNDFVYTLTCTSGCNGVDTATTFPIDGGILVGNSIEVGETQTYELSMTYLETGEDQSADMNKTMTARVNIKNIKETTNPYTEGTLAYAVINNAKNVTPEEKTEKYAELSATTITQPLKAVNNVDEALLSVTPDDYGTSYYYRGNVENNYVEFNGMCWRAVRIQGDGSVKLTLAAQKKCSEITSSDTGTAFIDTGDYGYDSSSYADYLNSQNRTSSMKYKFESWFDSKFQTTLEDGTKTLNSYGLKLKKDNWCIGNMRDAYSYDDTGEIVGTIAEYKASGDNFEYTAGNKYFVTQDMSLICETTGTAGEVDSSYIGALTLDEVSFAGGGKASNSNYYLNKNATSNWWWTLSPSCFDSGYGRGYAFYVSYVGGVLSDYVDDAYASLRPAVSLASGAVITSGNGTIGSPYVVG